VNRPVPRRVRRCRRPRTGATVAPAPPQAVLPSALLLLAAALGLCFALPVHAAPRTPLSGAPPGTLPGAPSAASPVAQLAPAAADTALAILSGPDRWPQPVALVASPDSLLLGETVQIKVEFPAGTTSLASDSLASGADWLVWEGPGRFERRGEGAAGRARLVRPARVYRLGPFRLAWQASGAAAADSLGGIGGLQASAVATAPHSPLIHCLGRLAADAKPAPIRDPRGLGWRWIWLAPFAALLALLFYGSRRLFRRRRRLEPVDRPIGPPAYLATACELADLLDATTLARGRSRHFLDRLAAILRRYLAARYGIPASGLTAGELEPALRARGHGSPPARQLAHLMEACEDLRYAPASPAGLACEELLVRAVRLLARARLLAVWTPVSPELSLAGERSWSRLWRWQQDRQEPATLPGRGLEPAGREG
jgi:hypothetical protein